MSHFQTILMWISAVAASVLSVVGLGIWCDRHQVFPGRRLLGAFRRLPWPVQFFLLAFSLHLIVHGSIKTNAVDDVEGAAQQRGRDILVACNKAAATFSSRDRNVASPFCGEGRGVRHAPYEIPFSHVGIGQDDDWVRANFTNATDILAVGYADWVDAQVGVDLTNGLYKFTATFPDDPPEATELIVGDKSVCVTNAGEYVFVLEKGVEYDFGTNPYDAVVEYSMQDDVGTTAEIVSSAFSIFHSPFSILSSWWWGDDNGVWTVDGGWQWISTPTIWGFGYCMWLPKFHGSPDVAHLGVDDFPMAFEAVLADCCRTNGVTYHWSTSTEGVRILSPNSRVTQVEVDALPSWDHFSLTVDAYLANETLTSTLAATYGTNATPQVSFGLSIPEVMFVNDDDDDDNGVPDCLQVTLDDDDIARGKLSFHSDVETNAIVCAGRDGTG